MSAIDGLRPEHPTRVAIVASNPTTYGNLITGQQQDSGTAAARLIIEALGV